MTTPLSPDAAALVPPSPLASAQQVSRFLARCRQRACVMLLRQYLTIAIALVLLTIDLTIAITRSTSTLTLETITLWVVAAGAIAAAFMIARAPTRRQIAALVDTRLQWHNRLVTTVQFLDDPEPMSRLLVRETSLRIDGIRLADAVPYRTPRYLPALVLMCAAPLLTLLLMPTSTLTRWVQTGSGVNSGGARRLIQAPSVQSGATGATAATGTQEPPPLQRERATATARKGWPG